MTGFPGLRVGHAEDAALRSGATVFLPAEPAVAAVHFAGGAPASRETDLLRAGNLVERIDALVLSGGSAFGLAAGDGVISWLAERGRGFAAGGYRVPIVPGASLFDLGNGGEKGKLAALPARYTELGRAACQAASLDVPIGSVGAGTGATTADLKGGFGAAEGELAGGIRLAAFAAVNPVGRVTLGTSRYFRSAPFEVGDEFGGFGLPTHLPADSAAVVTKGALHPGQSTTLGVVVVDCALTRDHAKRIAVAAHDGIALAIFPAHTPFDGDVVFTLATGERPLSGGPAALVELCAAAAATLARAIARAVFAAQALPGDTVPTWRERYG